VNAWCKIGYGGYTISGNRLGGACINRKCVPVRVRVRTRRHGRDPKSAWVDWWGGAGHVESNLGAAPGDDRYCPKIFPLHPAVPSNAAQGDYVVSWNQACQRYGTIHPKSASVRAVERNGIAIGVE
jgi:hypothetical protein